MLTPPLLSPAFISHSELFQGYVERLSQIYRAFLGIFLLLGCSVLSVSCSKGDSFRTRPNSEVKTYDDEPSFKVKTSDGKIASELPISNGKVSAETLKQSKQTSLTFTIGEKSSRKIDVRAV